MGPVLIWVAGGVDENPPFDESSDAATIDIAQRLSHPLELTVTIGALMANYIDGFVLPIPRDCLDNYKRVVEAVAAIWKEHGALDYREYVGDDLNLEGTRSFVDLVDGTERDAIVFGWVEFESREARDLANQKVAADPRMESLVNTSNSGFDAERMAYAGFQSFARAAFAGTD